jgi:signal transduction histidine kinase
MGRNWTTNENNEEVRIQTEIDDLIKGLKTIYPDAEYQVQVADNLANVNAPRRKLVRLFRNVLDNAFKYSAGSEKPSIAIEYTRQDQLHVFSISDSGPGIDTIYEKKIYDPFFRAPEVSTTSGTGMGLAIANEIVRSWGGKIWLDSDRHTGSKFSFTLPVGTDG